MPPARLAASSLAERPPRGGGERLRATDAYRRHATAVRRALARLGVVESQLDDAVHDVFLVLLRRLADYDDRFSARSWLFGIARRVASGYRRSSRRFSACRQRLGARPEESTTSPDEYVAHREATELLGQFLGELDDDKCTVYVLAELKGMRGPEIAQALDINLNTVYWRLRVAREAMDEISARHRAPSRSKLASIFVPLSLGSSPAWHAGRGIRFAVSLSFVTAIGSAAVSASGESPAADPVPSIVDEPEWDRYWTPPVVPIDDGIHVFATAMENDPSWLVVDEREDAAIVTPTRRLRRGKADLGHARQNVRSAKSTDRTTATTKAMVFHTVRSRVNEVRGCYNRVLVRDPSAAGRVVVTFAVEADGSTSMVEVLESAISDQDFRSCIHSAVARWRFPAAADGTTVLVRYPFVLSRTDGRETVGG